MKDEKLFNLIRRVNKYGIIELESSEMNRYLSKKPECKGFIIYNNRRLNKSMIVNKRKLRKLLGDDFFF